MRRPGWYAGWPAARKGAHRDLAPGRIQDLDEAAHVGALGVMGRADRKGESGHHGLGAAVKDHDGVAQVRHAHLLDGHLPVVRLALDIVETAAVPGWGRAGFEGASSLAFRSNAADGRFAHAESPGGAQSGDSEQLVGLDAEPPAGVGHAVGDEPLRRRLRLGVYELQLVAGAKLKGRSPFGADADPVEVAWSGAQRAAGRSKSRPMSRPARSWLAWRITSKPWPCIRPH